jgi:hypothetical protein
VSRLVGSEMCIRDRVQSLRELVRQSLPVMFTPVEESPGSIGQGDG